MKKCTHADGGFLQPQDAWDALSMREKAEMMKVAVKRGIYNLQDIRTKYNEFAEGGNTDDDLVDWIIREEGFIANPRNIGDGKMTLGSGLTAKKWHDQYKRNGNKWTSSDNRRAVREEVANRRRWAERNIPNWDSLPSSSQKALLSYKYNYDFNQANSPKLFKALADSNLQEAARQMNATSSNPIFRKGLQDRRQREQEWFLKDVTASPQVPGTFYQPAVSTQVYNPYVQQAEATRMLPINEPDPNSYIRTREVSPQEQRRRKFQENVEAFQRFNALMDLIDLRNNPAPSYSPTYSLFGGDSEEYANGGKIRIKPENRGKFTALKERTGHSATWFKEHGTPAQKKMATFALNSRHWKHGEGGNLFDGTTEDSQQMQIGLKVTNGWKPYTLDDILANAARIEQQKQAMEDRLNNVFTLSNDATSVANGRPQNRHLERRAVEGAKAHRAWEEEHPTATQWGNVLGAVPFAVAAYPLAATAGSGVVALGDAAAATSAGHGITNFLFPIATTSIAGATVPQGLDLFLTSGFGAHGLQTAIDEKGISPMTAIELSPMLRLGKPLSETAGTAYSNLVDKYPGLEQYPRYAIGKFKYGFDVELPTLYRKLKGAVPVVDANGNIALTNPNSRFRYIETGKDPMITNFTTDVPVRSHPSGHWEEGDVLALNGKTLLGHKVVSTRPSDTFTVDSQVKVPVNKTTFITGDKDMATQAQSAGYKVYSPEELQIQYQTADNAANNAGMLAHREDFFKGYEDFVERETRGLFKAPTAKDYAFMDYVFKPTYTSQTEPLSNLATYKAKGMMTAPMWLRKLAGTNDYKWRGIEHLDGNVLYHPYDPVESVFRRENKIEVLRKIPQVIRDSWKNK